MKRLISFLILFSFTFTAVIPAGFTQGVPGNAVFNSSAPGAMVQATAAFHPPILKGMTIQPDNPFQFDFIVDTGDEQLAGEALKAESDKLIKYFLASLTVPEDQMWVNLSPYEKNRIIPESFGQTEMGRDLLMQDYMLKQLTASLMYPDEKLGEEFWKRVYAKAQAQYGTTEIPVNTFNKIWIVPQRAEVYIHEQNVFVVDSYLKVMLEEDYLALEANKNSTKHGLGNVKVDDLKIVSGDTSAVVRDVLIPEIEREVNEGKTFANLRQIYNASILATWFKQNLKESVLGQIYVDQGKTKGVDVTDAKAQQKHIYEQYVAAFKKGAFDLIKEDYDSATQQIISRKYFSGGVITDASHILKQRNSTGNGLSQLTQRERRLLMSPIDGQETLVRVSSRLGSSTIDPYARWAGMKGGDGIFTKPVVITQEIALEIMKNIFKGIDIREMVSGQAGYKITWKEGKEIRTPHYSKDNTDLDTEEAFRRISVFLIPFFSQVIELSKLNPDEFLKQLERGELSNDVLTKLRSPVIRERPRSGNQEKYEVDHPLFEGFLDEKIVQIVLNNQPRRLKILLGGTLTFETKIVAETVYKALEAVGKRFQVDDVENWIKGWDIQIVGYSIETSNLLTMSREFEKDFPNGMARWVRLEYMDLLDSFQVQRMKSENPDIVFTVDSLYLGSAFGYNKESSLYKIYDKVRPAFSDYINYIAEILNVGGMFIIEIPPFVDPIFNQFMSVSPSGEYSGAGSGFYIKGGSLTYPMSLLGGVRNTEAEKILFQAWVFYLKGDSREAGEVLYEAFLKYLQDSSSSDLRFSLESAQMIVREYINGNFPDKDNLAKLAEKLSELERINVEGNKVDLKKILADLDVDAAVTAESPGGIDLNPTLMDLRAQGQAVRMRLPRLTPQQIQDFNINGLYPVIINIAPVTNFPQLLGFDTSSSNDLTSPRDINQPFDSRWPDHLI